MQEAANEAEKSLSLSDVSEGDIEVGEVSSLPAVSALGESQQYTMSFDAAASTGASHLSAKESPPHAAQEGAHDAPPAAPEENDGGHPLCILPVTSSNTASQSQ